MEGMKIHPQASSLPGRPSAPAGKPPEETIRDLHEAGAVFETPRWLKLFGNRRLDPEEAGKKLAAGKLEVRLPETDRSLPVVSPEDLAEAAVFMGLQPAATLPQAALASGLLSLEKAGWRFQANGNVGAYGALNELQNGNSLAVEQESRQMPLTPDNAVPLAAFYGAENPHPHALLENEGFRFFDAQGNPRLAWGDQPPAYVGLEGPWIAVGPDLRPSLERFEQLQSETGDLTRAQQIFALQPQEAPGYLAALPGEHRAGALPGVLRSLSTPEEKLAVGPSVAGRADCVETWLDALGTAEAKAVLGLVRESPPEKRGAVGQAFLASPTWQDGQQAAAFFTDVEGGVHGVKALEGYPDTRAAALEVQAWGMERPEAAYAGLLRMPDRNLNILASQTIEPADRAAQARAVQRLADPSVAAVCGQVEMTPKLFAEALSRAPLANGIDAAAFLHRSECASVKPLTGFADTRETAGTLERWNWEKFNRAWLEDPSRDPRELATELGPDAPEEVQQRVLADLQPGLPVDLTGLAAKQRKLVYSNTLAAPPPATGEQAAAFYQGSPDLLELGLEALRGFPDTRQNAERVLAWGELKRELLQNPLATDAELREAAGNLRAGADTPRRDSMLQELTPPEVARVALELRSRLKKPASRGHAFLAAMAQTRLTCGADAADYFGRARRAVEDASDRDALLTCAGEVLRQYNDTAALMARVDGWGAGALGVQAVLARPRASRPQELRDLAMEALSRSAGDARLQVLRDVAEPKLVPAAEKVWPALSDDRVRHALFEACLQADHQDPVALLRTVLFDVDTRHYSDGARARDQQALLGAALEALGSTPSRTRVESWQAANPAAGHRAVLSGETDPCRLALAAFPGNGDPDARLRALKDVLDPKLVPTIEAVWGDLSDDRARSILFRAALGGPVSDPLALLRSALAGVDARSYGQSGHQAADQRLLLDTAMETMGSTPARSRLESWNVLNPMPGQRALLDGETDLRRLARAALPGSGDMDARLRVLTDVADPKVVPTAQRLWTELTDYRARLRLFKAGLESSTSLELARTLLASMDALSYNHTAEQIKDQKVVLLAAMEELASPLESRMNGWQAINPLPGQRALLEGETDPRRLARAALSGAGDPDGKLRALQDVADPALMPLVDRIWTGLSDDTGRRHLFEATLAASSPPDLAHRMLARVDARTYDATRQSADQELVAGAGVTLLKSDPKVAALCARLERWQPGSLVPGHRALLAGVTDPRQLALDGIPSNSDNEARKRALEDVCERSVLAVAGPLWEELSDNRARQMVYRSAIPQGPLTTGEEHANFLSELLTKVNQRSYGGQRADAQALLKAAQATLPQFADTADRAARVAGWEVARPEKLLHHLLAGSDFKTTVLDVCQADDLALQDQLLNQGPQDSLGVRLARETRPLFESRRVKWALAMAAFEVEDGTFEQFVAAVTKRLPEGQERARVLEHAATTWEVLRLVQTRPPAAIEEQADRLVVGGVAVKKKNS